MFKRLEKAGRPAITFTLDGESISAEEGESVAAALLAGGVSSVRSSPVSGALRAPYCMMGACYECLVAVNGQTVQACMTPVRDGLEVSRLKPVFAVSDDGEGQ